MEQIVSAHWNKLLPHRGRQMYTQSCDNLLKTILKIKWYTPNFCYGVKRYYKTTYHTTYTFHEENLNIEDIFEFFK